MKRYILSALCGSVLCLSSFSAWATAKPHFHDWLKDIRVEALQQGISPKIIRTALTDDLKPLSRVLELDRKQPESTISFSQYKQNTLSATRVRQGRKLIKEHGQTLRGVHDVYGVPSAVVVALWGMETSYGNYTGGFDIVEALATLAYDGRRGDYFKGELFNALRILDAGHITPQAMTGSWAGAMGQSQFMPSSFLKFAVDSNGDGKRDIWHTKQDVFASASNYLKEHGWRTGERWGRRVQLPKNFPEDLVDLKIEKSLAAWQKLGVRTANGQDLPQVADMKGSVIKFTDNEAYLVYNNYKVIMRWNRSTYFATAVGLLSDKLSY